MQFVYIYLMQVVIKKLVIIYSIATFQRQKEEPFIDNLLEDTAMENVNELLNLIKNHAIWKNS